MLLIGCLEEVENLIVSTAFQSCAPLEKDSDCQYKYLLPVCKLVDKLRLRQLIWLDVLTLFLVNKSFHLSPQWALLHTQLGNFPAHPLLRTHL